MDKAKVNAAATVVAANAARQDSHCVWVGYDTQASENKVSHTVIEIESEETRHLLAHDSLAQVCFSFNRSKQDSHYNLNVNFRVIPN